MAEYPFGVPLESKSNQYSFGVPVNQPTAEPLTQPQAYSFGTPVGRQTAEKKVHSTNPALNGLFTVLENMNRLSYGVQNTIYDAVNSGDFKPLESFAKGFSLEEKRTFQDSLTEMGWKPTTTLGKVAKAIVGFTGDVALDPITYVGGVGVLNKASNIGKKFEAMKETGKITFENNRWITKEGKELFSGIDELGRVKQGSGLAKESIAMAKEGLAPSVERHIGFAGVPVIPMEGVNKFFRDMTKKGVDMTGLSPVMDAAQNFAAKNLSTHIRPTDMTPTEWLKFTRIRSQALNLQHALEGGYTEKAYDIAKSLKQDGIDGADMAALLGKVESRVQVKKGEAGYEAVGKIADVMGDITEKFKSVTHGLKVTLDDINYKYMPHILEKAGEKATQLGFGSKVFSTDVPALLRRSILKLDDGDTDRIISLKTGNIFENGVVVHKLGADDLAKVKAGGTIPDYGKLSQATVPEINKHVGEELFTTDIPKLIAIQGKSTAKLVSSSKFFDDMKKMGSNKPAEGLVHVNVPELAGRYYPKSIAEHIDKTYQAMYNPEELKNWQRIFDTIQNAWKKTATYWNPAFHSRNFISTTWQNMLGGVTNPAVYLEANRILSKAKTGVELTSSEARILKEYTDQGLSHVGAFHGDIAKQIDDELHSAMDYAKQGKLFKTVNKAGGAMGERVEDIGKMAHFISKRADGLNAEDAASSVRKYLFDYADLTDMERNVFKRVLPFYTFSRKNIPMELEAFVKNPERQSVLQKIKDNVEVMAGPDSAQSLLPDAFKKLSPVYIGTKNGIHRYVKLDALLPVTDLMKLRPDVKAMLEQVSPVIKLLPEIGLNRTFFSPDQEISKQKGPAAYIPGVGYGEKEFFSTMIPGKLEYLVRLFRPIAEVEKILGAKYANFSDLARAMNFVIGGKIYEKDPHELMKQLKNLSDKDARDIKLIMNRLQRQMVRYPEMKEKNMKYIKQLTEAYMKSRKMGVDKLGDAFYNYQEAENDANGSTGD